MATWQTTERSATGLEATEWMFTDAHGGPIHPQAMSQTFDRIVRRAPVPTIRFHDLRHTHATMLAELGASPKYVQHRLGHKNIQVTMNIYQHLTDKMSEEGARLLDTL